MGKYPPRYLSVIAEIRLNNFALKVLTCPDSFCFCTIIVFTMSKILSLSLGLNMEDA